MRLPRGRGKKGRPGKRLRDRRRPRRMPRGKLSWRSLKGRRGRRREKLRRSWPEKEKRNKRLVKHLAVGEVVEVEVVKMMDLGVDLEMMDPDLEVDLPGSQVLEDGEIENRRSRKNGVPEVEEEETEGLQDVDLLLHETGIEEMQVLGDVEVVAEMTDLLQDEMRDLHQEEMTGEEEETLEVVTLVGIEIVEMEE